MPAKEGPPSWTPEYRKQYYAKRKDQLNFNRRQQYKSSPERRAQAARLSREYRRKHWAELYEKQNARRAHSLVLRAKAQIGKCLRCGYNKSTVALQWAHVDPATKRCEPSWLIHKTDAVAFEELRKCILICSNCHWEMGSKLWSPSEQLVRRSVFLLRKVKNRK